MNKRFASMFTLAPRRLAAALLGAALGACTTVLLPPNVTPVVPATTSVSQAARKLDEVRAERAAVEASYAASEQLCYARFFVNNCLDAAKEKRRSALSWLRAVEVEAEYFQRKAAVEERDRAVARAVAEFEAEEARQAALPPPAPRAPDEKAAPPPKASLAARKASQAAKQARIAAQEKADAPKRAAKAAEFERKKAESLERQRRVEERKAEKAR